MKNILLIGIILLVGSWLAAQNNFLPDQRYAVRQVVNEASKQSASTAVKGYFNWEQTPQAKGLISEDTINPVTAVIYEVYPNPANQYVTIDYSIHQNDAEARFVIYNLLGKVIKDIALSNFSGTLKANTSDLIEGIYFYSFVINNQPEITQKLIIKH